MFTYMFYLDYDQQYLYNIYTLELYDPGDSISCKICAPRENSPQADENVHWAPEDVLAHCLSTVPTKIRIGLCECAGCYEYSLGAHSYF